MPSVVMGAALLGMWKAYKPVFYRLYYEAREDNRRSLLAISRVGSFAVAASLAYKHEANEVILSIVAPLTLATVDRRGKNGSRRTPT